MLSFQVMVLSFLPRLAIRLPVVVLLLWLVPSCAEKHRLEPLQPGAVVLAFGDSVTAGVGAGPGEDYPSRLAGQTGLRVINAGVSGDTAAAASRRLAALLAEHRPALVIVELGGNDFLRKQPPTRVKSSLRGILREARAGGAQVALVAVPALSLLRAGIGALADAPIYAELAEEEGALLIPQVFSTVLSDQTLRSDPIHPNPAGYRRMADGIHEALRQAGLI